MELPPALPWNLRCHTNPRQQAPFRMPGGRSSVERRWEDRGKQCWSPGDGKKMLQVTLRCHAHPLLNPRVSSVFPPKPRRPGGPLLVLWVNPLCSPICNLLLPLEKSNWQSSGRPVGEQWEPASCRHLWARGWGFSHTFSFLTSWRFQLGSSCSILLVAKAPGFPWTRCCCQEDVRQPDSCDLPFHKATFTSYQCSISGLCNRKGHRLQQSQLSYKPIL